MSSRLKWGGLVFMGLSAMALFALPPWIQSGSKGRSHAQSDSSSKSSRQIVSEKLPGEADIQSDHFLSGDSALREALEETDPVLRKKLLEQWADSVDLTAIEEIMTRLNSDLKQDGKVQALRALLSSWLRRDPSHLVTWFEKSTAADDLHQQTRDLMAQALAQHDPARMFAWMRTALPESVYKELYGPFFRQWAKTDPTGAIAQLNQLLHANMSQVDSPIWNDLLVQVAAEWASTNLSGTLDWMKSLPEGAVKSRILTQISDQWAQSDPKAAGNFAARENNPQALRIVAGKWAEIDPKDASAWVVGLPEGEGRNSALGSLSMIWAQKDPVAAAAFVAALSPGDIQNRAATAVVLTWASTQPAQTANWVAGFPESPPREQVMEPLISQWALADPAEAGQWVESLPATHSRDIAVTAYSNAIGASSPDKAFAWAESISDQAMRNNQLFYIASDWLRRDPITAQEQIQNSNLSQGLKQRLLQK